MNNKNEFKALFSFSIGPVQDFIASARTVRDLWSGSYILSWLTANAIAVVIKEPWKGVVMHLEKQEEHPLVELAMKKDAPDKGKPEYLIPCLPNYFIAGIRTNKAENLEKDIKSAVKREWMEISEEVRNNLYKNWEQLSENEENNLPYCGKWDVSWDKQINNFWDIRTAWLEITEENITKARKFTQLKFGDTYEEKFKATKILLEKLNVANKMIRNYPPHENDTDDENQKQLKEIRPKCCLCGKFSQMGPLVTNCPEEKRKITQMTLTGNFWNAAAKKSREIGWERIKSKDRFCAIHLVKRFAWRFYFCHRTGYGNEIGRKSVLDTSTIAAMSWMERLRKNTNEIFLHEKAEKMLSNIDKEKDEKKHLHWTGHWLQWKTRDEFADDKGDEPICPKEVWEIIENAREQAREKNLPKFPPKYYAIIKIDGDRMGDRFKHSTREQFLSLGANLSKFALENVQSIVENDHLGHLIYAGGDDVLAMVPTENALSCAKEIHDWLMTVSINEIPVTSSAGIVICHYKSDLRDSMEAAEKAEKKAKNSGRNCAALTIIRHSGIQTTSVIPWKCIDYMQELIHDFQDGASDRWSYQAIGEWKLINPALSKPDKFEKEKNTINVCKIMDAEVKRIIGRSDLDEKTKVKTINRWKKITRFMEFKIAQGKKKDSEHPMIQAIDNALILIQSASFLARGKEE